MQWMLITDADMAASESLLGERIAVVASRFPAGSAVVQVRAKHLDGGALLPLVRAAIAANRGRLPVIVNDRLDVALAAGASGVHLPETGLSLADARAVAPPGFAIGCSRHSIDGVVAAAHAGADWIQLGPVFETPDKGSPIGIDSLRAAASALLATGSRARLVAVGGISDPARAAACRAAGAHAIAAIRAAWATDSGSLIVAGA